MRAAVRVLTTLALVLAVGLTLVGSAEANTRGGKDPRGDAPRPVDMTHVQASYGAEKFHIEVRIPNIKPSGTLTVAVRNRNVGFPYRYLTINRTRRGGVDGEYVDDSGGATVRCDAKVRWSGSAGFVGATVDSSCIGLRRFGLTFNMARGLDIDQAALKGVRRG